jgi:nucleoside 2-deoxyribosyltransferase
MRRCFVIQPFDKGPYDQRYEDVLIPAIKNAELEPYRVDKDPAVSIPIESIEDGIQGSDVCLADITEDNPNVWFEVGYAIAAKKEVVFICSEDRSTQFPFDVQHRTITKYATASPRDFKELQRKITQRLKAILKSNKELGAVSKLSPTQQTEGLNPHEVAALVILMENNLSPESSISPYQVGEKMRRAGFTDVAVSIALNGLHVKGYMEYVTERDQDAGESYSACKITPKGLQWILDNQSSLVLKDEPPF